MIFIDKSGHPIPAILSNQGATACQRCIDEYDLNPLAYISEGTDPLISFAIDRAIYCDTTVKDLLMSIQNGKCCFCESKVRHISDGDVEHFRPKKRWKQNDGTPRYWPGYYWKAYDWDNLYLACLRCNRREKQDLFPLMNEDDRAYDHTYDVESEYPLFVDPGYIDPEDHIFFVDQYIVSKTFEGDITIVELSLDRVELDERRKEALEDIRALEDSMLASLGTAAEARTRDNFLRRLRHRVEGEGEYTNMFKCNFSHYLHLL